MRMICLILIVSLTLLAACSDTTSAQYDNWQAVSESGSIKRGWIPNWLPKEATNIHERHNLDTNASALSFDVRNPNFELIAVTCDKIPNAPKPHIKLSTFPPIAHESDSLKTCDGYYVLQAEQTFYLWQNGR